MQKLLHVAIQWFYNRIVLGRPRLVLVTFFILLAILAVYARNFRIDASSDTLVMHNNKDFLYFEETLKRYGDSNYLVVTYTPKTEDLFSDTVLSRIARLRDDLKAVPRVKTVVSLLDVPLMECPPVPLKDLSSNIKTLSNDHVDKDLVRKEFRTSPLYSDLIVSPDLKTTAIQILFEQNKRYDQLWNQRLAFREKEAKGILTSSEAEAYKRVCKQMERLRGKLDKERHENIVRIRHVINRYTDHADLFMGGVDMIADDMMEYVKNDLKIFGIGVFIFLVVSLWIIFRKIRWVILPMFCCAFSALAMIGILGMFDWPVTVVSSNFVSLQLIMTLAMSIHLIVRYREVALKNPDWDHRSLVFATVDSVTIPILYSGLTTIAGFASLLYAGIKPVITFGWMMSIGMIVSMIVTFIFFPVTLVLFEKTPDPADLRLGYMLTRLTSNITERYGKSVLLVTVIFFGLSVAGISQLVVENSFINYFKPSSEIYKGLTVIDRKLGGTTPLDVIIDFDETKDTSDSLTKQNSSVDSDYEFDEFDEFDEFQTDQDSEKYWFTPYRISRIEDVHDYLSGLKHVGKVLSLATLVKLARDLNGGHDLGILELSLIFNGIPKEYKDLLVYPYASPKDNEARIFLRVRDSDKTLRRNLLLKKIRYDLTHKLGFKPESIHLTNMLVLYNDILQRLFRSQILTLGIVLLALMGMFMILFRSFTVSVIAIFPNLLSIGVVLGFMGWAHIPLDIMTITIASISVGIAVDDTIHYIHRFKREIKVDGDYIAAMHRCHSSIGYAMFYTSITIIIGFSILVLSNFIPTINFGVLTGIAMAIAWIGAMTLLPELIILIKPFGFRNRQAQMKTG